MIDEHERLTARMRAAIDEADIVHVSAISFFEISQKVRLGKWSEMEPYADRLSEIAGEQGLVPRQLDEHISTIAGLLNWDHRDPFDRLIAATALDSGMTLVSADRAFTTLAGLKLIN